MMMVMMTLVALVCLLLSYCYCLHSSDLDSVVYPRSDSCENAKKVFKKATRKKFLLGAMFKDEEGYLAEFLSYYRVQGIDHVILWDNNSTDGSHREIAPWVASGFVDVRDLEPLNERPTVRYSGTAKFYRMMALKKETERQNILWGMLNGFDYYITADLDEYAFAAPSVRSVPPGTPSLHTVLADAVDLLFWPPMDVRGRSFKPRLYFPITKYNYNSQPHALEPTELLTLEAYLSRYDKPGGMNFYMNVMPKYVYRLSGADLAAGAPTTLPYYGERSFNNYTGLNLTDFQAFLSNCCYIHGCEDKNPRNSFCFALGKMQTKFGFETNPLASHVTAHAPYTLRMNHYARSLEKHTLKALTWATANHISATGYDLKEFLHRAYGAVFDPVLLQLGCAVRAEWGRVTGRTRFLREGDRWARSPEYGRVNQNHRENAWVPCNEALRAREFDGVMACNSSTNATKMVAIPRNSMAELLFPEYFELK